MEKLKTFALTQAIERQESSLSKLENVKFKKMDLAEHDKFLDEVCQEFARQEKLFKVDQKSLDVTFNI